MMTTTMVDIMLVLVKMMMGISVMAMTLVMMHDLVNDVGDRDDAHSANNLMVITVNEITRLITNVRYRFEVDRRIERVGNRFVFEHRRRTQVKGNDDGIVVQNWEERIVEEIEAEEQRCRHFLREAEALAPDLAQTWVMVVSTLVDVISETAQKLKTRQSVESRSMNRFLIRTMDTKTKSSLGRPLLADSSFEAVSDWLSASYTHSAEVDPRNTNTLKRDDSIDTSDPTNDKCCRRKAPLKTMCANAKAELRIGEWDFDAMQIERERGLVLQLAGFELLRDFLPHNPLRAFLARLEDLYVATAPYHSHVHAADMVNAFFYMVTRSGMWCKADLSETSRAAMLLAACAHDVGHFARNNMFLVNTRHHLAVTYNDRSVLENFHSATLVALIAEPHGEADDKQLLLSHWTNEQNNKARRLMTALILATDAQKHLEELAAFRLRLSANGFNPLSEPHDQQQSLAMLFRSADIGHSAKGWELHEFWSKRVQMEFHQQGDEERKLGLRISPLCDRTNFQLAPAQVGFLNFICLPTWRELSRFEDLVSKGDFADVSSEGEHADKEVKKLTRRPGRRHSTTPLGPLSGAVGEAMGAAQGLAAGWRGAVGGTTLGHRVPTELGPRRAADVDGDSGAASPQLAENATKRPTFFSQAMLSPRTSLNKVTPFGDTLNSSDTLIDIDEAKQDRKYLTEVCLAQCERNHRTWKSQAETPVAPELPPRLDGATLDVETVLA